MAISILLPDIEEIHVHEVIKALEDRMIKYDHLITIQQHSENCSDDVIRFNHSKKEGLSFIKNALESTLIENDPSLIDNINISSRG